MTIESDIGTVVTRNVTGPFQGTPTFKQHIHVRAAVTDVGVDILINGKVATTVTEVMDSTPMQITHVTWDVTSGKYMGTALRITTNGGRNFRLFAG